MKEEGEEGEEGGRGREGVTLNESIPFLKRKRYIS